MRTVITVIAPLALHNVVELAYNACDRADATLIEDGLSPAALRNCELVLEE